MLLRCSSWPFLSSGYFYLLPCWLHPRKSAGRSPQPSISAYYHQPTPMDDIYAGGLTAIGACLIAWRGFDGVPVPWWAATIASVTVLVTAYSPPRRKGKVRTVLNSLHFFAAVAFLLTLGGFAGYFAWHKTLYSAFVIIMVIGAVIAIIGLVRQCIKQVPRRRAVFWGEAIIVWGFSLAWIAKAFGI